jgi:hypothetical protein
LLLFAAPTFGAFLACGDDDAATPTPDGGRVDAPTTDTRPPPTDAPVTDTGTDAGAWDYKITVLANFNVGTNLGNSNLPDGVTVIPGNGTDYGTPLVAFNTSGRSATTTNNVDGGFTFYSYFMGGDPDDGGPAWPWVQHRQTDIMWDPTANTALATLTSFVPQDAAPLTIGVYKIPSDGGAAVQFNQVSDPPIGFPNSMGKQGNYYYVSDSNGSIFRIDASNGTTIQWATHAYFVGNKTACPFITLPTPRAFGIDGLAVDANNVYVSNFDYGALVKVPINANGTAGTPELVIPGAFTCPGGVCGPVECTYQGANGIAVDPDDASFYLSTGLYNALYHISADGKQSQLIYKGKPPLDFVGNMKIEKVTGKKRLLLTNFALRSYTSDAGPIPQLLQIDLPPGP